MDVGQVVGFVSDNWSTITTVGLAVGGSYAVKVQLAIKSIQKTVKEADDVISANQKALADGNISDDEAKVIAKEMQEFIVSLHDSMSKVTSILPRKLTARMPVKFGA